MLRLMTLLAVLLLPAVANAQTGNIYFHSPSSHTRQIDVPPDIWVSQVRATCTAHPTKSTKFRISLLVTNEYEVVNMVSTTSGWILPGGTVNANSSTLGGTYNLVGNWWFDGLLEAKTSTGNWTAINSSHSIVTVNEGSSE